MIKAVIFDFDGVIHDTVKVMHEVVKEIYPKMSLKEYTDLFNGNVFKHERVNPEVTNRVNKIQYAYYSKLKIEKEIKKELLKLGKKYGLHIISSCSEKTLNMYFENNDIHHLFTEVLGYETHTSKEHKFEMILKKFKLKKDECIFVTDTLGDILEANNVGIKTIAVDFGFHKRDRLEKGNPFKIISDFSEIKKVIKLLDT
jgi:HAD superfamily hydrolase (TIGR01509 family)